MKKMVLIMLGIILLAGMVAYAGGTKEGAGEFPVKLSFPPNLVDLSILQQGSLPT